MFHILDLWSAGISCQPLRTSTTAVEVQQKAHIANQRRNSNAIKPIDNGIQKLIDKKKKMVIKFLHKIAHVSIS